MRALAVVCALLCVHMCVCMCVCVCVCVCVCLFFERGWGTEHGGLHGRMRPVETASLQLLAIFIGFPSAEIEVRANVECHSAAFSRR